MSDFLLNLARRSAGLAPAVRARPAIADVAFDMPSQPAAEPVTAHTTAPEPIVVVMPHAAPALPALDAAPAPSVAHTPSPSPVAPRAPGAPEPASREQSLEISILPRPAETPAAWPRSEGLADVIAPALVPALIARIDPPDLPRTEERHREVVRESARVLERVVEPAASGAPPPVVTAIQPAEVAVRASPVLRAQPPQERRVHVNIGAIEIVGPDAGVGAQKPAAIAPPAVVAAPESPAPTAGGFDDYAALRSYAPWAW